MPPGESMLISPAVMPAVLLRLLFIAFVVLAGWFGISRLDFDVDPLSLLPQNLRGLEGTRLLRDSKKDQLIIALQAEDPELLELAAQSLADHLEGKPALASGLRSKSLLQSDPDTIAQVIADLWRNAPPEKVAALASSLQPEALPALLEKSRDAAGSSLDLQSATLTGYDPLGLARGALAMFSNSPDDEALTGDEFTSPDGLLRLLFVKPPSGLADYRATNAWLSELKHEVRDEWQKSEPEFAALRIGFTGDPAFQAEIATGMEADMRQSISAVTVIVGFLFWLLHRRIVPLFWLLLAILCANLLTLGAAGVMFGALNVMSMGFAAILTGLIEDFGVIGLHTSSEHPQESYRQILARTWPGVAWSAGSIAAIFAALGLSQLPGISQLGVLAAAGVLIGAAVMLLGFLPLGMRTGRVEEKAGAPRIALQMQKWASAVIAALLVASTAAIMIQGLPRMDFGSSVLRPEVSEAFDVSEQIESLMISSRPGQETLPLLVTAENAEKLRQTLQKAEKALQTAQVERFTLPTALVPSAANKAKNTATLKSLGERVKEFETAISKAGFTETAFALSQKVLERWQTESESKVELTVLAPREDGGLSALASMTLAKGQTLESPILRELESIPGVHPGGWNYLRHSLQPLLRGEITRICLPTGLIALLLFFSVFRTARERWPVLLVLLASAWIMLGAMSAFGWTWNLMSIGAVPLCLGLGLDFTIHMIHALREKGATVAHAASLGRSLAFCGLSTGLAFGALATGTNRGLISLGFTTMTGVLAVLLTSAFALPYVWFRFSRPHPKA